MSELDLIPADYARRQAVRRRLRKVAAMIGALALAVVAARVTLGLALSAEKGEVARLQQKKLQWQESKARTEKFSAEAATTERQLRALDELRGREQLRLFLEGLDQAYLDKVWFDEIRYYRHESLARTPEPRPAKPDPAGQRMEQRVAMTGHAFNHVTLAEFMRRLERQAAIADLTLLDTSPRTYPHGLIIDFKLAVLLEQKAKERP